MKINSNNIRLYNVSRFKNVLKSQKIEEKVKKCRVFYIIQTIFTIF